MWQSLSRIGENLRFRASGVPWRRVWRMFVAALTEFFRRNCPYVAAGIAFWALFALFPLALATISILGFVNGSPESQRAIVERIVTTVPVSSEYLLPIVEDVTEARGTLGVIAAVGALFSSTTVFSAIRKGINHAWHIEKPPYFLVERGQDMLMLIGVVVLAAIEVLSSTNLLGAYSLAEALNGPLETLILEAAARLLVLSVTFGTVSLMFRFLPNAPVLWREVWLGAAITSVCLHAIGFAFSTFFSSIGNFNLVYGSLGALMAMLMWAYLSAFSIMLGAQVCYGFSKSLGPRAEPEYLGSPSASGSDEGSERKKLSEQIKSWLMPPTGKH